MANPNDDHLAAEKLKEFLAKRGVRMLDMASQLAADNNDAVDLAAAIQSKPDLPSLKQVLKLIDGLSISVEDKLKLRQRLLNRAVAADLEGNVVDRHGAGTGGDVGVGSMLMDIASDYEFYLFAMTTGLVVIVFGKRMMRSLLLATWVMCGDDVEL